MEQSSSYNAYLISIHALLTESDQATNGLADTPPEISIHALLTESDLKNSASVTLSQYFYPRSPYGERPILKVYGYGDNKFLSTLSLRRATFSVFTSPFSIFYFYPRSPYGERHINRGPYHIKRYISIHALLTESDH